MPIVSLMLDCSRNAVPNKSFLKYFIDVLAKSGYNQLQLYTEDTYKIDGEPFFGYFRGAFGKEELQEIDEYAYSKGIELIPAIQVLGHLGSIFNWGEYAPVHDAMDCLLANEEKTYELIEKMIAQVSSTFRSKRINIGMDESFWSGKGEYLKRFGYKNPDDIYIEHLNRVAKILEKYDREACMWGDMFYRNMNNGEYYTKTPIVSEKTKKLIPSNVDIIYWDYYNFDKDVIKAMAESAVALKPNAYFAGGSWSWVGFMPRNDFAIKQTQIIMPIVKAAGIERYINTMWGDNGAECSRLSCLPAIYYFGQYANGITDEKVIKENFKKTFEIDMDALISLRDISSLDKNENRITNVCKYMLYNDPLMGIYDNTVDQNKTKLFTEAAEKYSKHINNSTYGYIFKTAYYLAKVLENKYDLGIRIRAAYVAKNKDKLREIIEEIPHIYSNLELFYQSFKEQWYKENKLEGFEIQTIRIGGLLLRLNEVKDLLTDFVNGKISDISVLNQPILEFKNWKKGEDQCTNLYHICASTNVHGF